MALRRATETKAEPRPRRAMLVSLVAAFCNEGTGVAHAPELSAPQLASPGYLETSS